MANRVKLLLAALLVMFVLAAGLWVYRQPRAHSVTLSWRAPAVKPGVTVVGYNIYRRPADAGPFEKIAGHVPNASYEDRLVTTGRTYVYAVTSIDQAGRESRYSEQASATVP